MCTAHTHTRRSQLVAPPLPLPGCLRRQVYDMIGVHVFFYGWPFHDSSGPREIAWDKEKKAVVDYDGDEEEALAFAEFNMLVWLCNCPRSAHGFFYDKPHKRWVMLDNDRCLGKRQQPFPKFLCVAACPLLPCGAASCPPPPPPPCTATSPRMCRARSPSVTARNPSARHITRCCPVTTVLPPRCRQVQVPVPPRPGGQVATGVPRQIGVQGGQGVHASQRPGGRQ